MNYTYLTIKSPNIFSLLFLMTGMYASTKPCVANQVFQFGVVPQQEASKIVRSWLPLLKYLKKQTGYSFVLPPVKNIPVFEENLARGNYDFAYMNPYQYVVFNKHMRYTAFAKAKDKKIKGIIVVEKESAVNSIKELNNKEVVFPSPLSFAASMVTRADLSRANVNIIPRYASSHDGVYNDVVNKKYVAGSGVIRTFNAMADDIRKNLKIIHETRGYTPHAFAAHPDIPIKIRLVVQEAMRTMNSTKEGQMILDELKIEGITSAHDKDWDDVRSIKHE